MNSIGIKTHDDRNLVSLNTFTQNNQKYNYRPYDIRNIDYDVKKVVRHRYSVMKHLLTENIAICNTRQINPGKWEHCFITNILTDICYVSIKSKESTYIFPLYLYNGNNHNNDKNNKKGRVKEPALQYDDNKEPAKKPNFTEDFTDYIKSKYKSQPTPEQILGYIYAVLHSPTYRTKYIEFLKIDFPRVPFTEDEELFYKLSENGWELIQHHLMKKSYETNICKMEGSGGNYLVGPEIVANMLINKEVCG